MPVSGGAVEAVRSTAGYGGVAGLGTGAGVPAERVRARIGDGDALDIALMSDNAGAKFLSFSYASELFSSINSFLPRKWTIES